MTDANTARPVRKYRGQTTEQLKAERRERLLQAGEELIGSDGYGATSIDRLCSAGRVSTRHFYEHFSSREELLGALFDAFIRDAFNEVLQAFEGSGQEGALAGTLAALTAFARFCMNNPERARIALVETVGVSPAMEEKRRAAIRQFAGLVAQFADKLAAEGVLPEADYQLSGIALVGASNELLVEWLSGGTGLSREQMERRITGIFQAIIKGSQAIAREKV
ncbi:hypothetical protein CAI21_03240 [Alkalilimnicola ehrlichii]|uniref:HTH tetR-type domain-containing protein n=1 Tax=Alkalilimnicola ehrlichii TaxID=351052 RepID=A0A3E0X0J8_9GAMM|nr:TetR/AcrR family transcriptional regulator [Alkalilimnicola ehrlichii]RFA31002.1 hypothetical protein CAI21_03240 [Alkalilimnicola ehrlichii]RFA38954.1 hypothetical protein CAL65_03385 [Alkalilimnicola ehrlichii]